MKLISYENKGKHIVLYDNEYNEYNDKYNYKKINIDNEISNEDKIEILDNLLDINSINRCYILYFIFKKQGTFYASIDSRAVEAFNSYDEYIFWKNIHGDDEFNLDETLPHDLSIYINDKEYTTNHAQINFISWVYYSGLYDYLMQNQEIKKDILDKMNEKNLLYGHHFLRYVLFINEYKSNLN